MTNKEIKKYIRDITENKLSPVLIVNSLMEVASYDDMKAFEQKLPVIYRGLLKLPYLRRKEYKGVFTTGYLINKSTPIDYIDLLSYIFEKNSDILNVYVQYRDAYEIAVLKGDYPKASILLDKINKEVSYSLWSAINDIKVTRLSDGLNKCNEKMVQLSNQIKDFGFILFWNYQTSSVDISFSSIVDRIYNEYKGKDDNVLNYIAAHCFPYKGYSDEGNWVTRDFNSSIVDLYVSFIHLLTRHVKLIKKGSIIAGHLSKLSLLLHDPVLVKYVNLINGDAIISNSNLERISIIKAYLKHEDNEVLDKSPLYLAQVPTDFPILDVWVRTLIKKQQGLPKGLENETLFGKVAIYYYKYMKYGGNHHLNYSRLNNIYRAFHTLVCFRQLGEMIESRHLNRIQDIYKEAWRYSAYSELSDAAFYDDATRTEWVAAYLSGLNMTESVNADLVNGDFPDLVLTNRCFSDNEWKYAISVLHNNNYPAYIKGPLTAYIIDEQLKKNQLADAISLYVEQKIFDPFIQIQVDIQAIKRKLDEEDTERNLHIPLIMSIFHTITNSISSKRKLAYRRYLKERHVERASDLPVDTSDSYLMCFLTEVVDTDVLQLDGLRFKNSIQALDEQIKIYQNLYNATGDKEYYNELVLLDNEKTIKGLSKTLDQSKIFVDTDALIEREVNDLRDLYGLYTHTGGSVKSLETDEKLYRIKEALNSIIANVDKKGGYQVVYFDTTKTYQEVNYKNSLFKQFYLAVRDKFLLDPKYGLDYHLSTRIRHGFLSNQIRTNFADKQLVTNIGTNNDYSLDTYWSDNTLHLSDEGKAKCKQLLLEFTIYLDSIISTIKDELIQVKTEEINVDLNSCFDYSDKYLNEIILQTQESTESCNFDVTVNSIFDSLWGLTEFNLQMMKDQLNEYSLLVQARMDTLEHEILQLIPSDRKGSQQLKAVMADSKTQFLNDMQSISRWFNRRNELASEFKLDLSLQTCIDTINRINQYKIEAEKIISSENIFKGIHLSRFNDLFHNLLNNVLDYNKKKFRNGKCRISLVEDGEWLTIKVSNDIDAEDITNVKGDTVINKDEIDAKLSSGKSRGEGHSGIVKIYNIIYNVLRHPGNSYSYEILNGTLTADIKINISNLIQNNENINS